MNLVEKINAYTTRFGFGQAYVHASVDASIVTLSLPNGDTVRLPREPGDCPEAVITLVADAASALMEATTQARTVAIVDRALKKVTAALAALDALPDGPGDAWATGVVTMLRRRVAALDTVVA